MTPEQDLAREFMSANLRKADALARATAYLAQHGATIAAPYVVVRLREAEHKVRTAPAVFKEQPAAFNAVETLRGAADRVAALIDAPAEAALAAIVEAAVMKERERCAKIVDDECARILAQQDGSNPTVDMYIRMIAVMLPEVAAAIRAGGK